MNLFFRSLSTLLIFVFISTSHSTSIWIDADPALFSNPLLQAKKDIDDALAIAYALESEEFNLIGISSSYGNCSQKRAFASAQKILHCCNQNSIPLTSGPNSKTEIVANASHCELINFLNTSTQDVTYLALGPLTNLAAFAKNFPQYISRISKVFIIGGKRRGKFWKPWIKFIKVPDANVEHDWDSTKTVLQLFDSITLLPYELSSKIFFTRADYKSLTEQSPNWTWLYQHVSPWLTSWEWGLQQPGHNPFDVMAVSYLLRPELFHCLEQQAAKVHATEIGQVLEVSNDFERFDARVTFCHNLEAESVKNHFFQTLMNE